MKDISCWPDMPCSLLSVFLKHQEGLTRPKVLSSEDSGGNIFFYWRPHDQIGRKGAGKWAWHMVAGEPGRFGPGRDLKKPRAPKPSSNTSFIVAPSQEEQLETTIIEGTKVWAGPRNHSCLRAFTLMRIITQQTQEH